MIVWDPYKQHDIQSLELTGSAVITHDVTTGTGCCLIGFNWSIDFFELANQTQIYINLSFKI